MNWFDFDLIKTTNYFEICFRLKFRKFFAQFFKIEVNSDESQNNRMNSTQGHLKIKENLAAPLNYTHLSTNTHILIHMYKPRIVL